MRKLANLFLILFIASAATGILHILLQHHELLAVATYIHRSLWGACLLTGFLVYLGLGFNRYLPKRILVPLFLWLFWSLVSYWPLDYLTSDWGRLMAYVAQLVFGAAILKFNFLLNNKGLLLAPEQFGGSAFSFRNLVTFSLVSCIVIPATLLLILFSVVGGILEKNTGGFVVLRPDGLYMMEKVYHLDGKDIHLVGMIHLGQGRYYADLIASIPTERTLILAEGVTDNDGLMRYAFSYGNIAKSFGLSSQEQFHFAGRHISLEELSQAYIERHDGPHVLAADIDLRQFSPRSIEVLNAIAKYLLNAESLITGYLEFNRWAEGNITVDTNRAMMYDLIDRRNRAVIALLPKALERYDRVIIPWGALHMKGIEAAVREKDFYLHHSHLRRSISFFDLPYSRILRQFRTTE